MVAPGLSQPSPHAKLPALLTPQPEGTAWLKFEVFGNLTLLNQNKPRSPSGTSGGRGNSSWREEERKSFSCELLLGCFAQGGTATIICYDSRQLQPGGVLAGLAATGRGSVQDH